MTEPLHLTLHLRPGESENDVAPLRRAIRAQREQLRRKLKKITNARQRRELNDHLKTLGSIEGQLCGVKKRSHDLPLDHEDKPYVPSVQDIEARAVVNRCMKKDNWRTAVAKLALIKPEYRDEVRKAAQHDPALRRALNRVGSDILTGQANDTERIVLENYYASKIFRRPLRGMAWDHAAWMIETKTGIEMSADKYRRILRKFYLA